MKLKLTYMGRSYDAAAAFPDLLDLPEDASVAAALAALRQLLPDSRSLPESCLVIVSGNHLGTVARHRDATLTPNDELVLIAPVAGG